MFQLSWLFLIDLVELDEQVGVDSLFLLEYFLDFMDSIRVV